MVMQLLLSLAIASLTVVVHAIASVYVVMPWAAGWRRRQELTGSVSAVLTLIRVVSGLLVVHLLEVGIWAMAFIAVSVMPNFESSLYYSLESYTTVGYGHV